LLRGMGIGYIREDFTPQKLGFCGDPVFASL